MPLIRQSASFRAIIALIAGLSPAALWAAPATISGTITETGGTVPVDGATVLLISADTGAELDQAQTNSSGEFTLTKDPGAGASIEVQLEAAGPAHAPARYNGPPQIDCFLACGGSGGEFIISDGDTLTDRDFALDPGASLAGTINDADSSAGIGNARINVLPTDNIYGLSFHFQAWSDASGSYELPLAVPGGNYHVLVDSPSSNHVAQAWQAIDCQHRRCPIRRTDDISLAAGNQVGGIDFELRPGATISGSLQPSMDMQRVVSIYSAAGLSLEIKLLDATETDWSFDSLAGGSYYLEFGPRHGTGAPVIRQLHNGLRCPYGACNRARGAPISVPQQSALSGVDITLDTGGMIYGSIVLGDGSPPPVTGQGSGLGLYQVIDASGEVFSGGRIREVAGEVLLEHSSPLPPGDYYVRTYSAWRGTGIGYTDPGLDNSQLSGFTDAMAPDVTCAGIDCDLGAATPVTVAAGSINEVEIIVEEGSMIHGSVLDESTDEPIANAVIKLFDGGNLKLATTLTDDNGLFAFGGFPAGDYFIRTAMSSTVGPGILAGHMEHPYFDKVHGNNNNCSEQLCNPAAGTPIAVDGQADTGPIDLTVAPGPVIRGSVIDTFTSQPVPKGHVEINDDTGTLVGRYGISHLTAEYQSTALAPGTYTVTPVVSPAFSTVSSSQTPSTQSSSRLAGGRELRSSEITVTIGSEDVTADLYVVDRSIDRLFQSRFEAD